MLPCMIRCICKKAALVQLHERHLAWLALLACTTAFRLRAVACCRLSVRLGVGAQSLGVEPRSKKEERKSNCGVGEEGPARKSSAAIPWLLLVACHTGLLSLRCMRPLHASARYGYEHLCPHPSRPRSVDGVATNFASVPRLHPRAAGCKRLFTSTCMLQLSYSAGQLQCHPWRKCHASAQH